MELLTLGIVGAVVSAVVQGIKKFAGTSELWTLVIVVVVSGLAGWAYFLAKDTAFWPAFVQIVTFAGAVYTYLISRFPGASNS